MKRAYILAILLLFGVFPLNNSSGEIYNPGTLDHSFSTPINLKLESTIAFTDEDAKEYRRDTLDADNDGTVTGAEVVDLVRTLESTRLCFYCNEYTLNEVFADADRLLVDYDDAVGPTNSSETFTLEVVETYTFDISPDLEKYTLASWLHIDEAVEDGLLIAPFKITVPEGYKITEVNGFNNSDLSDSERTINARPIDDIVVVFEKENSLLSSTSLIPALISIVLIAIYRRK